MVKYVNYLLTYVLYDNIRQSLHHNNQIRWSRYTVVCRAAQENGARANYVSILTGTTKSWFSHIHNSVVFYLINSKVAVEVPAYLRRLHIKFEENRVKLFRDMSKQTFKFFSSSFRTLEKIAVTHKLVLQSSWNLVHLSGVKRQLSASILVRICSRFLRVIIDHLCKTKAILDTPTE